MQQTTRKAVRYYIDHDAGTPVIRSVPVTRSTTAMHGTPGATTPARESATAHLTKENRRGVTRNRLVDLVQSSVRKRRRQAS